MQNEQQGQKSFLSTFLLLVVNVNVTVDANVNVNEESYNIITSCCKC